MFCPFMGIYSRVSKLAQFMNILAQFVFEQPYFNIIGQYVTAILGGDKSRNCAPVYFQVT